MIRVSNARCRFGRHALLRVEQWEIRAGKHWCLFGPNGAGKSLLAALVSGALRQSAKYVSYSEGFDPARHVFRVSFEEQQRLWRDDDRRDISEYSASARDPGTLVGELIASARRGEDRASADAALFEQITGQLGLEPILDKGIRFLSSGQVRRALLARGLYGALQGPRYLLILDDVLESIDRDSRDRIQACIEYYMESGFTSLHLCRRASEMPAGISHLALMQDLRLLESGPAASIMSQPRFREMADPQPALPESLPILTQSCSSKDAQEQDGGALIQLDAVNAGYGELSVLRDINWSMGPKEHVAVEGPNGCGKSTLLSLIDGENHKGYGQRVTLFGRRKGSGETIWETKSRFGVVSNELHNRYVKGWRVLDVVVSGFFDSVGLYDDSGSSEQAAAREWLQSFGIDALASRYYHELSFGQQRLVLLARAMVKQPSILVLDEPCVGLDDYYRRLILGVLDLIAAESVTRLIYVSHVPGEEPACINSRLRFVPHPDGGHTLRQEA